MVTDDKVNAILTKLAKVTTKTQINAIQLSLDNGYMNIDPDWLNKSKTTNNRLPKELILKTPEEREAGEIKRQEFLKMVAENDPSLQHF